MWANRTILLVLCGSPSRRNVLEHIAVHKPRIVCVHQCVSWATDLVSEWIVAPCDDRPASLAIVQEYVQRTGEKFDAVMAYDEFGLALASLLARHLQLPFLDEDLVEKCRDKFEFRRFCQEHGIPSPRYVHLDLNLVCDPTSCSPEHHKTPGFRFNTNLHHIAKRIEDTLSEHGLAFPVVIKPTHGAGKMCTRRANTALEAAEAVCMLHERMDEYIFRWRMTFDEARGMVIEEYLEGGPEVDADCLVQNGKLIFMCINENRPPSEPWFLESGGMTPPPNLSQQQQIELRELSERLFAACGPTMTATVHFEAKYTPRGIIPIELNLRLGGAETFMMVKAAYGVDLIKEATRMQLGEQLDPADFPDPIRTPLGVHASSTNIQPAFHGTGLITELEVPAALATHPAHVANSIFFKQGDTIRLPPDGNHYLGWIVARGATHEEAEHNLDELIGMVHLRIEPFKPTA